MTKLLANKPDSERRLDRFELIAELASGGMATVYLARLSGVGGFQRFVAIKRLHPHLAKEQEFTEMFLDEARLAARLHHPNVVPILEIGQSDEGYYLVMEYIEGDTLGRLLARSAQSGKAIPPAVGMRICLDAIAGLHVAHELQDDDLQPLNIVHRDVSPQNILVGVDGSARITDFGVARASTRLSTTRTGQLKGKLSYMAPEQAKGQAIDRRADLFAMGIVIWETLTQKRLFKGEGEADTLNRVLYEPIPSVRSANPSVPIALNDICMRALERDPDKRFSTAMDLGDTLEKAARAVGSLGTSKEVAAYLDSVLGTDISQQRDAVRAWLSRSEPSQRFGVSGTNPAFSAPSITRVDGRGAPDSVSPTSGMRPADGVSSVSSAIIQLPGQPPQSVPPLQSVPPPPRSRAWLLVAPIGLVLAAGALFIAARMTQSKATPTVTPAATQPAAPAQTSAVPLTTTPAVPSSAQAAVSVPIATTQHAAHPTSQGAHTTSKPTATASTPTPPTATATNALPDDISKNPYR